MGRQLKTPCSPRKRSWRPLRQAGSVSTRSCQGDLQGTDVQEHAVEALGSSFAIFCRSQASSCSCCSARRSCCDPRRRLPPGRSDVSERQPPQRPDRGPDNKVDHAHDESGLPPCRPLDVARTEHHRTGADAALSQAAVEIASTPNPMAAGKAGTPVPINNASDSESSALMCAIAHRRAVPTSRLSRRPPPARGHPPGRSPSPRR